MKKKILVADDDPSIVDAIQLMLEMDGYDVFTTSDGEVMGQTLDHGPDVLLLDIWMSGYDGREICKLLKNDIRTKHIPVIMLSATRDIKASAKQAGADDYIAKPFEMADLLEKVKKYANVPLPIGSS